MWLLYLAIAAEVGIFSYVGYVVIRYCIPWDEIRRRRALRDKLAVSLVADKRRIAELRRSARAVRRQSCRWARDISVRMTRDSLRFLDACERSLDAAARFYRREPDAAEIISSDVRATMACVSGILHLRDVAVPATVRARAAAAKEMLDMLESFRQDALRRAEVHAAAGRNVAAPRRRIEQLKNAIVAGRGAADGDPDPVIDAAQRQFARLREIAVDVEVRALLQEHVQVLADRLPERVTALHAAIERRRGGPYAERGPAASASIIESAENHLRAALALMAEPDDEDGYRTREALLMAERADAALAELERSLGLLKGGGGPVTPWPC